MDVNDVYQTEGKHLKAEDLKGKKHRITIVGTETVSFKGKDGGHDEEKILVMFRNRDKGLVLNKTNAMVIASQYGPETEQWAGKEITIYPTTTSFGDKQGVPCIRVEQFVPDADPDDEIGF